MMAALAWHEEGILCEKVKQYPVLFGKQLGGQREKDAVTDAWNAVAKEIEIGKFFLFSRENNQEGCIESEAHLEPNQASAMELF